MRGTVPAMGWVDTHCHLQLDGRAPSELLGRADEVDWVVVPGVDAASSAASLELAERHPGRVLGTAGLHPHEASEWPNQREAILELAPSSSALGETGLDYYRELSDRKTQRMSFVAHLDTARDLGKPVIVHCRDAFADTFDILDSAGLGDRVVLHCWTGGRKWTRRFLDLGVMFSFAGPLAFDTGETIRLAAEMVPPERAMVETDTPYLAPPPHRGKQNEPAWVEYVGAALARVWGHAPDEVREVTSRNAHRVFRT